MKKLLVSSLLGLGLLGTSIAFAEPVRCIDGLCVCDADDEECLKDLAAVCGRLELEVQCDGGGSCWCEW